MRLFGTPGGSLDNARATYGFTPPFDLAFAVPGDDNSHISHGGFVLDLAGAFTLQFNQIMMAYPDWVFVAPSQQFNPFIDDTNLIGNGGDGNVGITGNAGGDAGTCEC